MKRLLGIGMIMGFVRDRQTGTILFLGRMARPA